MIKKLRIKLIVASMISLFLVLFIIGGIAGVLNYRKIAEDADRILEVLENALCLFGGCIRWYRLRDEACSSIAHIREDLFRGMRRKTLVGKGFVRHVHQIGKRMEQRAVEVEDERFVCSLFTHSCP